MQNLICLIAEKLLSSGHVSLFTPSSQIRLPPLQKSGIDRFRLCQPHPRPLAEECPTSLLDIRSPTGWDERDIGKLVLCSLSCMSLEDSCCQPTGKLQSRWKESYPFQNPLLQQTRSFLDPLRKWLTALQSSHVPPENGIYLLSRMS